MAQTRRRHSPPEKDSEKQKFLHPNRHRRDEEHDSNKTQTAFSQKEGRNAILHHRRAQKSSPPTRICEAIARITLSHSPTKLSSRSNYKTRKAHKTHQYTLQTTHTTLKFTSHHRDWSPMSYFRIQLRFMKCIVQNRERSMEERNWYQERQRSRPASRNSPSKRNTLHEA